jgi:hypothetical protein
MEYGEMARGDPSPHGDLSRPSLPWPGLAEFSDGFGLVKLAMEKVDLILV